MPPQGILPKSLARYELLVEQVFRTTRQLLPGHDPLVYQTAICRSMRPAAEPISLAGNPVHVTMGCGRAVGRERSCHRIVDEPVAAYDVAA
ncbi:MAG: hypothetical protein CMJ75_15720 [Planctomycetaceae bacterium]|nr:hypothetical protein [Planctomycetaceae bacterium]